MYYNKTRKKQFISFGYDESEAEKDEALKIMRRIAPFEKKLGKDVCEMSVDELNSLTNWLYTYESAGKNRFIFVLTKYANWCVANNIPNATKNIGSIAVAETDLPAKAVKSQLEKAQDTAKWYYNAAQKERFINECCRTEHSKKQMVRAMKNVASMERSLDKDVCEMSPDELQTMISEIYSLDGKKKRDLISILRTYASWCSANDIPNATMNIEYLADTLEDQQSEQENLPRCTSGGDAAEDTEDPYPIYNEQQKKRFMKTYKTKWDRTIFKRFMSEVKAFELQMEKDVCTMNEEELKEVVKGVIDTKQTNKWSMYAILRDYIGWCIKNNIPGTTYAIKRVFPEDIEEVRRKIISGPLQLQAYLDAVFYDENEHTIDNLYRCWLWMAFSGIEREMSFSIKKTDVNFSFMEIQKEGVSYPIYKEGLLSFRDAVYAKEFRHDHKIYKNIMPRCESEFLMSGKLSEMDKIMVNQVFWRRSIEAVEAGKTTLKMRYEDVLRSGKLYRLYEREMAGLPLDFYTLASKKRSKRLVTTDNDLSPYIKRDMAKYETEYSRWKFIMFGNL